MKPDSQKVGNVRLYLICYHLSLLGWNTIPSARNARGIDIVPYCSWAINLTRIQIEMETNRYSENCLRLMKRAVQPGKDLKSLI